MMTIGEALQKYTEYLGLTRQRRGEARLIVLGLLLALSFWQV